MQTNNMPHFSFRITSTTPLSSCIVTASGTPPVLAALLLFLRLLLVAVDSQLPGGSAPSKVSGSVPLLCIAYRLAATVPWVRSVATGMGGWDA